MSLIRVLQNRAREEAAFDDKFYQQFIYFFELVVPPEAIAGVGVGGTRAFLFPLVLNPESITMEEPFTVEATPTAQGGLFVEENGIVQRRLTISGHTGWRPRRNFSSAGTDLVITERSSFDRRGIWFPGELSGQRHFQFLQDRVFRIYGDLKRDPATARDTQLIFHNPKDAEDWLVVPQSFQMDRSADEPLLYRYRIELLVVDKAAAVDTIDFSEDKPLLDQIKDGIRTVRAGVDNVLGAINDVINFVNEIENVVRGAAELINDVASFANLAADLVNGTADLIAAPFSIVASLTTRLETAATNLANSPLAARETVANSIRNMVSALDSFAIHPEFFQEETQAQAQRLRFGAELSTSVTPAALTEAANNPPANLNALAATGTGLLPGDQDRARAERGLRRNEPVYRSAVREVVNQGDTLPALAARYLGDARLWRRLALLNNLQAPYITEQGLPGTLKVGQEILIPSREQPPSARPLTTIFGARPTDPIEEQIFGTDFRLVRVGPTGRQFDFEIDTNGGSEDFNLVTGIPNIAQAMVTRATTEQGANVLYRRLGYKPIVATNIPGVDGESAQFRLAEAIVADPRISEVTSVRLTDTTQADTVSVDIDAAVQGLKEPIRVSTRIPS